MKSRIFLFASFLLTMAFAGSARALDKLNVLIIDGQNNHDWKATTPVLRWILESVGMEVEVATTPPALPAPPKTPAATATAEQKASYEASMAKWKADRARLEAVNRPLWEQFHPKFKDYNAVVSNYNGEEWPEAVRKDFVDYVRDGGGLVIVHAADNAFGNWPEYNEMIGLGGWGGRNEKSGPMIRYRDGKIVEDTTPGAGGTHGTQHQFVVETRQPEHPIMKGLPAKWMAATDELYAKLRGPAKDMSVLATAYSAPEQRGTGENEPILMVINYGKGRVFHTTLGHSVTSMSGLGFQVTLRRGVEWVATGKVTQAPPKPEELPADKAVMVTPPTAK